MLFILFIICHYPLGGQFAFDSIFILILRINSWFLDHLNHGVLLFLTGIKVNKDASGDLKDNLKFQCYFVHSQSLFWAFLMPLLKFIVVKSFVFEYKVCYSLFLPKIKQVTACCLRLLLNYVLMFVLDFLYASLSFVVSKMQGICI